MDDDVLTTDQRRRIDRRTRWERRFQSVMITLCAAGVVWGVQTLVSVDKNQAISASRLERVEIMQSGMYTARDAKRDVADMTRRIETNEKSIIGIDSRLQRVEARRK